MLRVSVGARFGILFAICLLVLLVGPAGQPFQKAPPQPSTLAQCEEYSRKAGELQSITDADIDGLERSYKKRADLQLALRGLVASLQTKPDKADQTIRAILLLLPQLKQAGVEHRAAGDKLRRDNSLFDDATGKTSDCFYQLRLNPNTGQTQTTESVIGVPPGGASILLTVGDKTETVNMEFHGNDFNGNGTFEITSTFRQGIKLPSRDPAATNSTAPVTVDKQVTATVRMEPSVTGRQIWLGLGADGNTPVGPSLCVGGGVCQLQSGPYPGVRKGLGKGWAASEAVEVWLCRVGNRCAGKVDPVATINISWVPQ